METVLILLVASSLSAAVVWWATAPPGGRMPRRFRRRDPPRITFTETFQTTGPEPADGPAEDGFVMLPSANVEEEEDDRPPAILSTLRLAFAIALVAALGVAVVSGVGFLVKLQLDQLLQGS
jgi:hypothetical protein